jgi:hypothetical protein
MNRLPPAPVAREHESAGSQDGSFVFEQSLGVARLDEWVTRLGVEDEYERLKRA